MARRATNRSIYFQKHVVTAETPEKYVAALAKSPFRTHRRAAIQVAGVMNQANEAVKESKDFAAKMGVTI